MTREEAIEIIKRNCINGSLMHEACELLLPELFESEDERIRKKIITIVKNETGWQQEFPSQDQCLSYLERQEEQKPAEWSEDYQAENIQTRFAFYTYKDDPSVLYLSNVFVEEASRNHGFGTRILKAAEKAAEAIGAISIRLKVKQDSRANAWYRKNGYGYIAFEYGYDWLEKNLEYTKPPKPAEWNEEDEKMIDEAIELIKAFERKCDCPDGFLDIRIKLKSLRPDGYKNCNSRWRPSEEQMDTLQTMVKMSGTLRMLYNDLKNLL